MLLFTLLAAAQADLTAQVQAVLEKDPTLFIKAQERFFKERYQEEESKYTEKINSVLKGAPDLLENAYAPTLGEGSKKIALFTSPYCPYCRALLKDILKLPREPYQFSLFFVAHEEDLGSYLAARALLTAAKLGKFQEFFEAMMKRVNMLEEDDIFQLASSIGLDSKEFTRIFNSQELKDYLKQIYEVQSKIGLAGLPTMIYENSKHKRYEVVSGRPSSTKELTNTLSR